MRLNRTVVIIDLYYGLRFGRLPNQNCREAFIDPLPYLWFVRFAAFRKNDLY